MLLEKTLLSFFSLVFSFVPLPLCGRIFKNRPCPPEVTGNRDPAARFADRSVNGDGVDRGIISLEGIPSETHAISISVSSRFSIQTRGPSRLGSCRPEGMKLKFDAVKAGFLERVARWRVSRGAFLLTPSRRNVMYNLFDRHHESNRSIIALPSSIRDEVWNFLHLSSTRDARGPTALQSALFSGSEQEYTFSRSFIAPCNRPPWKSDFTFVS